MHGLSGDHRGTWTNAQDEYWPDWIAKEFPEMCVWALEYAANISWWEAVLPSREVGKVMALPDRGLELLDYLTSKGLGDRPLFFICHSLGGLVAKQILRKAYDETEWRHHRFYRNTRAVLFLATPHDGAGIATIVDGLRVFFGTQALGDLKKDDPHLRDLKQWYALHPPNGPLATACYYELRPVKGLALVVSPGSAHPGAGTTPIPQEEDHFSLVKPASRDAPVHLRACSMIRELVLSSAPAEQVVSKVPVDLPPPAATFVGRGPEVERLQNRLAGGQRTAVVGPAGMGKTALAAKAVRYALRGGIAESPFPDGVIYLDLYVLKGASEATWDRLATRLEGPEFHERRPARVRAEEACKDKRILLIIEGGEEADGRPGRSHIRDILAVLPQQSTTLLLTRLNTQSLAPETIRLYDALQPDEAQKLFDSIAGESFPSEVRDRALALLGGHPLAITWAANLLARDDADPAQQLAGWHSAGFQSLTDPLHPQHTLDWLFHRSVAGLSDGAQAALDAMGLLAHAPVPFESLALTGPGAREGIKVLQHASLVRRLDGDRWQFVHILAYNAARRRVAAMELLQSLGEWLRGRIQADLATGGTPELPVLLDHLEALLARDTAQHLWLVLAKPALYDFDDRLTQLGGLVRRKRLLGAVETWFALIPPDQLASPEWRRERATLHIRRGNVLFAQGDLSGALVAYRESLTICQRLAADDPINTIWQRDLSVSHSKVGTVLTEQGDFYPALAAYRESFLISTRLTASDMMNAEWQRDRAVGQCNLGDMVAKLGDHDRALEVYEGSLADFDWLAALDRKNPQRQRDISAAYIKIGDVLRLKGELCRAQEAFQKSLEIRRGLVAGDKANAEWQRDLSMSLLNLSLVHRDASDRAKALSEAEEALTILERLVGFSPENAEWQRLAEKARKLVAELRSGGPEPPDRKAAGA